MDNGLQTRHNPLSLAGMLMAPVTGLELRAKPRSAGQQAHLEANHKRQFDKAVAKYRALFYGRGWVQTKQVEWLAGTSVTGSNAFLRKLKALGYITNRPTGGTDKYFKSKGWDWRWVDGK